jgi:hypothetical protein
MSLEGRFEATDHQHSNGRNRRVAPVAPGSGESLLSDYIAAVASQRRGPLNLPLRRHCDLPRLLAHHRSRLQHKSQLSPAMILPNVTTWPTKKRPPFDPAWRDVLSLDYTYALDSAFLVLPGELRRAPLTARRFRLFPFRRQVSACLRAGAARLQPGFSADLNPRYPAMMGRFNMRRHCRDRHKLAGMSSISVLLEHPLKNRVNIEVELPKRPKEDVLARVH